MVLQTQGVHGSWEMQTYAELVMMQYVKYNYKDCS